MALPPKLLISLMIGIVCTATGVAAGVGGAFCLLRDEGGGPGVAATVFVLPLLGLVIGLTVGLTGAVMLWRRAWVPVAPLPPAPRDTAGAVWSPLPSRSKTTG